MKKQIIRVEASAGSGKTYALAKHYLKLLLSENNISRASYSGIMAITFTNKATIEMKTRVLLFLKKIALNCYSSPEERKDFLGDIKNSKIVAAKAEEYLNEIICNYDDLHIMTIDSVFNSILKSFSSKVGLNRNFKIKDNFDDAFNFSVKSLFETMSGDKVAFSVLHELMSDYIYIAESPSWLPQDDLIKKIKHLYQLLSNYGVKLKITNIHRNKLAIIKSKIKKNLKIIAEYDGKRCLYATLLSSIDKILSNRKISIGSFKEIFTKEELPYLKNAEHIDVLDNTWRELRILLRELCENEAALIYNAFIKVLNATINFMQEYAYKNNCVYISDINYIIRRAVLDNKIDVAEIALSCFPYVNNILIDEFQDTNKMNWNNLCMLIEEALSKGGSLFYVGDKKQAIFQFRGADSYIFDEVEKYFPNYDFDNIVLNTNYRSESTIVNFNNNIFAYDNLNLAVKNILFYRISLAHSYDVEDTIRPFLNAHQVSLASRKKGYVSYCVLSKDEAECLQDKILSDLNGIFSRGFCGNDIAILVRTNQEVEIFTDLLLSAGINVESEKTTSLKNNKTVAALIHFLKFLNSPIDNMAFSSFLLSDVFLKATACSKEMIRSFLFEAYFEQKNNKKRFYYIQFREKFPGLWNDFIEIDFFKRVGFIPVYEFVREIIEKYGIVNAFTYDYSYLMRFLELLNDKLKENDNLKAFLEFYDGLDENSSELYVRGLLNDNAVKILTIHSAKGLEFPVVIIPSLSMPIIVDNKFLVDDRKESYVLHIQKNYNYFSDYMRDIYTAVFKKALISELNIMYVALTRASIEMYVYIPERIYGNRINHAVEFFKEKEFTCGQQLHRNDYEIDNNIVSNEYYEKLQPAGYGFSLAMLSEKFISKEELLTFDNREYGKLIHYYLSYIYNMKYQQLQNILLKVRKNIVNFYDGFYDLNAVENNIKGILADEKLKDIFYLNDNIEVYNEKVFADKNGNLKRIDRLLIGEDKVVIVDYKIVSNNGNLTALDTKYIFQLNEYAAIIKKVYPQHCVECVLCYISNNFIEVKFITPSLS